MKNTKRYIPLVLTAIFACVLIGVFIYRQNKPSTISLSNIQKEQNQTATNDLSPIYDGKININQASAEELTLLPGIGETLAKRIVEYRDQNGSFNVLEDLLNVSGIGEGRFKTILDYVTLGQ